MRLSDTNKVERNSHGAPETRLPPLRPFKERQPLKQRDLNMVYKKIEYNDTKEELEEENKY